MSRTRTAYDDVVVTCPVTVPYVRYSIRGAHWFLAGALAQLLKTSGLTKDRLDGLCVSSFTLAPDSAVGLTQHLGLTLRWLDHIPMGGACGVVALRRAARAVQSGDADAVACVAGDTNHPNSFRLNLATFSQFARDAVYPYGSGGANASFAFLTAYYMRTYGVTREDFGKICVAQRANALEFPLALMKKPLTLAEYLSARLIADPLRLYDCVMPCAGADAFLVLRRGEAEKLGLPYARIMATIERHNAYPDDPIQYRGGWALDRDELYAQAGRRTARHRCAFDLRRLSGHHADADRGSRFLRQGRGRGFRPPRELYGRRLVSAQHLRRPIIGRPSRRGRRLLRPGRDHPAGHRTSARRRSAGCPAWSRERLRYDQLRPRLVQRRRHSGSGELRP